MRPIAIIPARAGSQRLPGKNLMQLGGKALVQIAVDCAIEAGIPTVIVSTDSDAIWAAAVRGRGLPISSSQRVMWCERPRDLAGPEATSLDVMRHALGVGLHAQYQDWDVSVLLQPTSPFRLADDVKGALQLHEVSGGDAVVSVTKPITADWFYELGHANRLREAKPTTGVYVPNGAIYILSREALKQGLDWWPPSVSYGYVMPRERSLDIDTRADFDAAVRMMETAA